ncbi:MAG: hypothetical protein FJ128_11040 [Deltaproteobacteria bacterium]|nr:hypothetical protein [Deltaproteobacteria bacterium]MBM4285766.1 hypothetical protein [Deltaproteobacteria bacterium]
MVKRLSLFIALALCGVLLGAAPGLAGDFTGRVVGVMDGDTITVYPEGGASAKVRLYGIDAPERRQPYSNAARKYLSDLVFGKKVRVRVRTQDRYGRVVAEIIREDGVNVNQEMLRAGYAWWYRKYAKKELLLLQLEQEARRARRGLWADPRPAPPWEFRKGKRKKSLDDD